MGKTQDSEYEEVLGSEYLAFPVPRVVDTMGGLGWKASLLGFRWSYLLLLPIPARVGEGLHLQ